MASRVTEKVQCFAASERTLPRSVCLQEVISIIAAEGAAVPASGAGEEELCSRSRCSGIPN